MESCTESSENFGFPAATGREHVGIVPPIQYTPAQLAFMEAERSRQVAPVDPDTIARQAQKDISAAKMDVKVSNLLLQEMLRYIAFEVDKH